MRRAHPPPLEAVTIASVLIAHDQQDVGSIHRFLRPCN
jgi:hypothetical protein